MMRRTFLTSALDMPEIMSYIYSKSWKHKFSASSSIIIIEDYYLQTFLHSLKLTEEWKSYRADEPSEFYLKTTKIGGILFALFGIIMIMLPVILE